MTPLRIQAAVALGRTVRPRALALTPKAASVSAAGGDMRSACMLSTRAGSQETGKEAKKSESDGGKDSSATSNSKTATQQQPDSKSPPQAKTTQTPKQTQAERDAALFRMLDDREGGGAGNEIVDGEYEKGMTRHTRANQYRVI